MNFLDQITNYWQIITFVGGLVWTWSRLSSRIGELEKDMSKIVARQELTDTTMTEIKVQLAGIQTTLEFIKQQLQNDN